MKKTKILIVEDEIFIAKKLQMDLERMGYTVTSAVPSGELAIKKIKEEDPDIVLMDIMLEGEMDGIETTKIIQSNFDIPVIYLTAYEEEHQFERAKKTGATGYITKPFKDEDLKRTIEIALYKHKVEKERKESIQELSKKVIDDKQLKEKLKDAYDELRAIQEASVQIMEDLEKEILERKGAEKELEAINETLEQRVKERTKNLEESNEELRKSEEKYRRLIEGLQDKFFFYSHNTEGVFTYLSPSITNVLGYSPEEFLTHYSEYMTDCPGNENVGKYTDLSLKGIKQPPYEVEIYHKDGTIRTLNVQEVPVFDNNGKVIAVEGIAEDITGRKQAEKALLLRQQD